MLLFKIVVLISDVLAHDDFVVMEFYALLWRLCRWGYGDKV